MTGRLQLSLHPDRSQGGLLTNPLVDNSIGPDTFRILLAWNDGGGGGRTFLHREQRRNSLPGATSRDSNKGQRH